MTDASTCRERSNRESTHIWPAHHSTEERGGVSRANWHLKQHEQKKWRTENRAYFDRVKVFFTLQLRNFNQNML